MLIQLYCPSEEAFSIRDGLEISETIRSGGFGAQQGEEGIQRNQVTLFESDGERSREDGDYHVQPKSRPAFTLAPRPVGRR